MSVLERLKSMLGLANSQSGDRQSRNRGNTSVTVEHEPDVETEAAVKGTDTEAATPASETTAEPAPDMTEPETADEAPTEDEDASERDEVASEPVTELSGIGPAYGERLAGVGIESVADLAGADAAAIAAETDLSEKRVAGWIEQARER